MQKSMKKEKNFMKQWIRILKNGSILLFLMTFLTVSSVHAEQILINVTEEGGSQEVTVGTSGNFQVQIGRASCRERV